MKAVTKMSTIRPVCPVDKLSDATNSIVADSTFELEIKKVELKSGKHFPTATIAFDECPGAEWSLCVHLSDGSAHFCASLYDLPDEWEDGLQVKLLVTGRGKNHFETTIIANDFSMSSSITDLKQHFLFNSIVLTFRLALLREKRDLFDDSRNPQYVKNVIFSGVSKLLGDPTFSDFTFTVKGREFRVHMNILAAASPVMRRMFTSDLKEARTRTCEVDSFDPEIFGLLLRFIYCGELPNDLRAVAKSLYEAAHYYDIGKLKTMCAREINKDLSLENALQVYEWIQPYDGFKQLKHDAWTIIRNKILKVFHQLNYEPPSFAQVDALIEQEKKDEENRLAIWRAIVNEGCWFNQK